ncbi:mitochondrial 39-S ribosomal protein L47 (MRP-L47)-domain-containing protein [Copromyces sp. CBS 386.78]|nr:mitochondrial 39-S ribosomal protein L47 (MRP-L47)-domain-containing protein [Copromyces sp. CBS 386.78]
MASPAALRPSMGAIMQTCRSAATAHKVTVAVPVRALSTSAALLKRHKYPTARVTRDNSKKRGESALRKSGTRWKLSVSDEPLPEPVPRDELPPIQVDENHGLWDFFYDRETVALAPMEHAKHGRAWTVSELRKKSWDDLHKLWWVCVKERNRIATANWERTKSKLGFGTAEATDRDRCVKQTMRGIKHVLTERFYAWEDAVKLAEQDPEIDLSDPENPYKPSSFLEAEEKTEGVEASEAQPTTEIDPSTIPSSKSQPEALRL